MFIQHMLFVNPLYKFPTTAERIKVSSKEPKGKKGIRKKICNKR